MTMSQINPAADESYQDTQALLNYLQSLDIKVSVDANNHHLKLNAPKGTLSAALQETLKHRKAELLAFISEQTRISQTLNGYQTIQVVDRSKPIHASFAQQRLWFLDQLAEGKSHLYNIPLFLRVSGNLHISALIPSVNEIIRRHEVLRVFFQAPQEGTKEPYQKIMPALVLDAPLHDLTTLEKQAREARIQQLACQEAKWPFDLAAGPLLRLSIIKTTHEEHLLLFNFHHTIFDGLSIRIFLQELKALYTAYLKAKGNDQPLTLPPPEIQYADFSQWQRDLLSGENLQQQLAFWLAHLDGAPAFLELPTDNPRPVNQELKGARFSFTLDSELTQCLRELSQNSHTTLFMTLYAAFAIFLARHANVEDLVIGTPVANRNHRQLESLIGFFANTLALRFHVEPDLLLVDFLQQVKATVGKSLQYQHIPFEKLVDELKVERNLNHNPLFQVMFTFQDAYLENFSLPELTVSTLDFNQQDTQFDLTLIVREYSDKLVCIFEYAADLFESATITRMSERFRRLLQSIIESPQTRLADLALLPVSEQQTILKGFNPPVTPYPLNLMLHQLVEAQAAQHPDRIAACFKDTSLSYAELNTQANQLAHQLIALGVQPGIYVGICLERSLTLLVAILGILKAGGAYIPLDPSYPDERLQFMLEDADAQVLITQTHLLHRLPAKHRQVFCIDTDWQTNCRDAMQNPTNRSQLHDLAYIIYTSGSTGKPKGVMVNQHNLLNTYYAYAKVYPLTEISAHLQMANYAFDVFSADWIKALCSGSKLVLCPSELLGSAEELYALMRKERIESADLLPSTVRQLNTYLQNSSQQLDFLKVCVIGSDTCYMQEYREFQQHCSPQTRVISAYGVTEATIDSTYIANIDMLLPDDAIVPIGKPFPNTQIYVLDKQHNPVPIGVPGEIYIGGASVAQGYLKRPALTAEKFIHLNLNGKTQYLYKSGDAARWRADGNLEFMGRLDNQIKLRGLRIELGEIETALIRHPLVKEAVVLMVDTESTPFLSAYVVLKEPVDDLNYVLRSWLESQVPSYMVPSAYVVLEAFPLTPNGKVNRNALPVPNRQPIQKRYMAPRDSLELRLTLLWEKVLDKSPLSIKDNFFEIGGDSLLAIRLISTINREFGKQIPLHTIFQNSTIEQLTTVLRQSGATSHWNPLVCLQPQGAKTPLFCVHAAGGIVFRYLQVASLLGTERPFYGIQARGIEHGDEPYASIEEMAADYVKAIRTIQPHGPYLLAGWSFGGSVAFEMARMLEQEGENVPLVLMIDAPSPYVDGYEPDDVEFMLERLRPAAGLALTEVYAQGSRQNQLIYLFKEQKLAGLLAPDIDFKDAELRMKIHMHHNKIICEYRPVSPFQGKIIFFKPMEKIPFDSRMGNPITDWASFARQGIEVHEAPGNHFNMFSPVNGPVLARQIKACIEQSLVI